MKRTYPANIDGQIFYIDEDAYLMLQDYLQQLKVTFHGAEGREIVTDIESRIREHFDDRVSSGANVIVIDDVTRVIETMGRPEQISPDSDEGDDIHGKNTEGEECKPFISFNLPGKKRFYRSMKNKVFGGVFGGLAAYLGWDANIMRILYVVLTVLTYFWPCALIYLVAWMVIPPANTPRRILEMNGDPVNVDTVGQTVIANSPSVPPVDPDEEGAGLLAKSMGVIGKMLMGFLGIIGGLVCVGCMVSFLALSVCILTWMCCNIPDLSTAFSSYNVPLMCSCILVWLLAAILAFGSLAWAACCVIFNASGASKTTKITIFVMEIILIAFGIALSVMVNM